MPPRAANILVLVATILSGLAVAPSEFQPVEIYSTGIAPTEIAVADFDNDGWKDIVVGTDRSARLYFYWGSSDGEFARSELEVSSSIQRLLVTDYTGDGRLDLVCLEHHNQLFFLVNSGSRQFEVSRASTVFDGETFGFSNAAILDLGNDGSPEIIYLDLGKHSAFVFPLAREIDKSKAVALKTSSWPRAIVAVDANRDQRVDLVVGGGGGLTTHINISDAGKGHFETCANKIEHNLSALASGDFNEDGQVDMASLDSSQTRDSLFVFFGLGTGYFEQPKQIKCGREPKSLAVADLNKDGHADIITANWNESGVGILAGRGDGTFEGVIKLAVMGRPSQVAAADLNRDGWDDLIVTSAYFNNLSLFFNARGSKSIRLASSPLEPLPATTNHVAFTPCNPEFPSEPIAARTWGLAQGLPHETIQVIHQSRNGFLWLGSRAGLFRFDGQEFIEFNKETIPAMLSDTFYCIAERENGEILAGTPYGILWLGRGAPIFLGEKDGLLERHVRAIAPGRDNAIWIGTGDGLCLYLDGKFSHVQPEFFGDAIEALVLAGEELFAGTKTGLKRYHPRTGKTSGPLPGTGHVLDLKLDAKGGLWGLERSRLFYLRNETWQHYILPEKLGENNPRLTLDPEGDLWISAPSGLFQFQNGQVRQILGTAHEGVEGVGIYPDQEGGLWLGGNQLSQVVKKPPFALIQPRHGLAHQVVKSVHLGRNELILGTDGGLSLFDCASRKFSNHPSGSMFTFPRISGVYEDSSGQIWVGNNHVQTLFRNHLERFQGCDGVCTNLATDLPAKSPLLHTFWESDGIAIGAHAFHEDRQNRFWIAGRGLERIAGHEIRTYGFSDGLPSDRLVPTKLAEIFRFYEEPSGAIWMGTLFGGLICFSNDAFRVYTTRDGLPSDIVQPFFRDENGALWLGTDKGLVYAKNGQFRTIGREHGLPDDVAIGLLDDDLGYYWINTFRGLSRVAKEELNRVANGQAATFRVRRFTPEDGLPPHNGAGGSGASACKTPDGRLLFATMQGLLVVNPRQISRPPTPPVVIESVLANHATPPPLATISNIQGLAASGPLQITPASQIVYRPGEASVLEIKYSSPGFRAAAATFRYRLNGYDRGWIEAGPRRVAYYTNLRPGKYQFEVNASHGADHWNPRPATIAFIITPFFHQTYWFYLTLAGAASLVLIAMHRYRLQIQKQLQRIEQEGALQKERTRIAQDLHDDLGSNLTRIGILTEVVQRQADGAVARELENISSLARETIQQMSEMIWVVDPKQNSLEHVIAYLREWISRISDTVPQEIKFNSSANYPEAVFTAEGRRNLLLALKEAIHNSLKHSGATRIEVTALLQDRFLEVSISDNGAWLNSREEKNGHGLENMRQRMRQSGGNLDIQTGPNGTLVRLELPFKYANNPGGAHGY